jgi:hypothetical protein
MSYDVSVGREVFNYTSNVAPLFYDHIPKMDSIGGLHELSGKTGRQGVNILRDAFVRLHRTQCEVSDPVFCAKYDAANGWGSTAGALIFLAQIMAACADNPRGRIRVSA